MNNDQNQNQSQNSSDNSQNTPPRGCGRRVKGGIYLVSKEESPLNQSNNVENLLIDPVEEINNIPKRGVLISGNNLYDRVGESNYPNVQDFIAEAKNIGISRRISPHVLKSLGSDPWLIFVHPKAGIKNFDQVAAAMTWEWECQRPGHKEHTQHCLNLARFALDETEAELKFNPDTKQWDRTFVETTYSVPAPYKGKEIKYFQGAFLAVPISQIEYISTGNELEDKQNLDKINRESKESNLPIFKKNN